MVTVPNLQDADESGEPQADKWSPKLAFDHCMKQNNEVYIL